MLSKIEKVLSMFLSGILLSLFLALYYVIVSVCMSFSAIWMVIDDKE